MTFHFYFCIQSEEASGPAMLDTPVPVKTNKLSNSGPRRYLNGRLNGNSKCCRHGFRCRCCLDTCGCQQNPGPQWQLYSASIHLKQSSSKPYNPHQRGKNIFVSRWDNPHQPDQPNRQAHGQVGVGYIKINSPPVFSKSSQINV